MRTKIPRNPSLQDITCRHSTPARPRRTRSNSSSSLLRSCLPSESIWPDRGWRDWRDCCHVIVRRHRQHAALFDEHRLFETVDELPFEVVSGNRQQGLAPPVRPDQVIPHVFAAVVHVGRDGAERFILLESVAALHLMARVAGRKLEEDLWGRLVTCPTIRAICLPALSRRPRSAQSSRPSDP